MNSRSAKIKSTCIKAISALIPAAVPPCHILILYYFWKEYGRRVNKQYCSCSCWDTVFKGTYESGIASYKHLYFNATSNTAKIWIMTVIAVIILYESWKHILSLLFNKRLRLTMLVLFLTSLFSHYYAWWVYVNYWNDDFYEQWNHQLFFTTTEVISTGLVLHLADNKIEITRNKVCIIISIAVMHIFSGGLDQFLNNVIFGEGFAHQIVRDISFMIPDILHALLPIIELKTVKVQKTVSRTVFGLPLLCAMITFIFLGCIIISYL